ncbi:MAG: aminotransferase class I/II-fold pyridoxal phosphate-dependent enzyme [Acidimicrobiales bacterium]
MSQLEHNRISGRSAREIVASVEGSIRRGRLAPGARLPTVRALADDLDVSPATVAAAFRDLRVRGLVSGDGRRGTRVVPTPPLVGRPEAPVPAGVRDLSVGHPDARLLPRLRPLARLAGAASRNYEAGGDDAGLLAAARAQLAADHIPTDHLAVVGGALDGVERVLAAHLRPADRVAVEDPGFSPVFDLLRALGLRSVPVDVDDHGPRPDALSRAITKGVDALIFTPRAQNPTGAALDDERARALRRVLRSAPDLLVIEDDHAGPVAGAAAHTLATLSRARWAVVRSVSKSLGPDLRLAVLAGDEVTVSRVAGRQSLGTGWVSTILQRLVADLWDDPSTMRLVDKAAAAYTARRRDLVDALAQHGISAVGHSGLNVWIPVPEEAAVVRGLRESGWAVDAGERYRLASPPAIRVTVASMAAADAKAFAADLARVLSGSGLGGRRVRT